MPAREVFPVRFFDVTPGYVNMDAEESDRDDASSLATTQAVLQSKDPGSENSPFDGTVVGPTVHRTERAAVDRDSTVSERVAVVEEESNEPAQPEPAPEPDAEQTDPEPKPEAPAAKEGDHAPAPRKPRV